MSKIKHTGIPVKTYLRVPLCPFCGGKLEIPYFIPDKEADQTKFECRECRNHVLLEKHQWPKIICVSELISKEGETLDVEICAEIETHLGKEEWREND